MAQGREESGGWGIAADVFQQRHQAGVSHTQGAWQPLPRASLQLDPAAAAARRPAPPRPPSGAALVAPQLDPWLLGGGDGGEAGGWPAAAARSSRARMLFQFKPYSQQEPLDLGQAEVAAVVEAVFGRMGGGPSAFQDAGGELWGSLAGARFGLAGAAASTGEVAGVILVKLVLDLYLRAGARTAFPLTLLLLQHPLLSSPPSGGAQARVFDLLLNLSVHGELLYDAAADTLPEDAPAFADAVAELGAEGEHVAAAAYWKATVTSAFRATLAATLKAAPAPLRTSLDGRTTRASTDGRPARGRAAAAAAAEWPPLPGAAPPPRCAAAARFQQWLRLLLAQLLGALAASGATGEAAWAAALSCLVHLITHDGAVVRAWAEELPLGALAALLEAARRHAWSEQLHAWLLTLAANLLYVHADGEEHWGRRSLKAASLADSWRSGGSGGGAAQRGGGGGGGGGGSGPDPAWWAGAQLDSDRLAAFGGVRQVLRCFREAPTADSRRCMFAVLLDHVLGGQRQGGPDAWAPALLQAAHSSEAAALGAALLRTGAAEALHPLLLAGAAGAVQPLADAVSMQMAALQAANPGRIVSVPGGLVGEVLECLEELAASDSQVPAALHDAVKATLEAVAAPEAATPPPPIATSPTGAAAIPSAWRCLADCMRDPSDLGARAGRGWLLQLLLAAAEREVGRGPAADGAQQQLQQPPQQEQLGSKEPPPALLPEVSAHGGCQLQPGRRGLRGQEPLRELLVRALATTLDRAAADCFMAAVAALLAHVRLRCAAAAAAAEAGEENVGGGAGGSTPPPAAAAAGAAAPGGGLGRSPSAQRADGLEREGSASALRAEPSDGASSGARSSPFEAHGGWRSLDCSEAVLSTLSLAVEWLLQAPREARQPAMLRATQLLLAFTLAPRGGGGPAGGGHGGGGEPSSPAGASPAGPRPSTQHRLSAQTPPPLQLPSSPGSSPAAALSPGGPAHRPVSPNLAALQAAAAAATPSAKARTPRTGSLERLQSAAEGGAAVTAADVAGLLGASDALDSAAAAAALASGTAEDAEAAAESCVTQLWSFLNGRAMVPQELLRLLPPLLLRTLFEDLRPDSPQPDLLAAAGGGASAAARAAAADEALAAKAAVQAERPLWDARAAVLLLLMGRCGRDAAALGALGGAAFFVSLLGEADGRVRHYAAVFVLRQLMTRSPLQYRRALRGVVARAQAANDEKLLSNPYLQLRAMLDQGSVQLDAL